MQRIIQVDNIHDGAIRYPQQPLELKHLQPGVVFHWCVTQADSYQLSATVECKSLDKYEAKLFVTVCHRLPDLCKTHTFDSYLSAKAAIAVWVDEVKPAIIRVLQDRIDGLSNQIEAVKAWYIAYIHVEKTQWKQEEFSDYLPAKIAVSVWLSELKLFAIQRIQEEITERANRLEEIKAWDVPSVMVIGANEEESER